MDNSWETIKNRLLALRAIRGSVAQFCQNSGIPRQTVEYWLNGKTVPGIDRLPDIAAGLGITPGELFADPASPRAPSDDSVRLELIALLASGDHDKLAPVLESMLALVKDTLGADVKARKQY